MLKIPENKTRKKLRITLCVLYLVEIVLPTSSNTPAQYANYILWFMFFQVSLKIKESLDK